MLIFYSVDMCNYYYNRTLDTSHFMEMVKREIVASIHMGYSKDDTISLVAYLFDMVDYDDNLDMFYPGLNWRILENAYNEVTK